MKQRQVDAQAVTRVTMDLMEEHLVKPAKTQNMIQFHGQLDERYENPLTNSTSHEASLETLLYHRVIAITGQHEAWEAYLRDKDK
jgi:hypothetical protein